MIVTLHGRPHGSKLAYALRQDGNWEIYVYDFLSGDTLRLTYDLSYQGHPSWSNDGQYLVYESYQGENLVFVHHTVRWLSSSHSDYREPCA
jgi:Tol biopolymer transport system component